MARRITDQGEAVKPANEAKRGVTFVKNQVNQRIVFEDKTAYQFPESCHTVTDPELIEKLRSVAKKYGIFERD